MPDAFPSAGIKTLFFMPLPRRLSKYTSDAGTASA
jgi:hypothetical protein